MTKGYALSLKGKKGKRLVQPNKRQIKDDKKRRRWCSKLSVKEKKMMKGYILLLRGTRYDWHDQNKVLIIQGKKREVLVSSSTNVNEKLCLIFERQVIPWALSKRVPNGNDERLCLTLKRQKDLSWDKTTRAKKMNL